MSLLLTIPVFEKLSISPTAYGGFQKPACFKVVQIQILHLPHLPSSIPLVSSPAIPVIVMLMDPSCVTKTVNLFDEKEISSGRDEEVCI